MYVSYCLIAMMPICCLPFEFKIWLTNYSTLVSIFSYDFLNAQPSKSFTYLFNFIHWCFTFSVVFHCCPIYVIFSLKWCSTVTAVVIFLYVWLKASPLSSLSSLVFDIILYSISNFIWTLMLSYCYTKLNGSKAYLYGNKSFDIWNYLKWLQNLAIINYSIKNDYYSTYIFSVHLQGASIADSF